jgi:tetratricopeptide (TPR) repeat protein
MGKPKVRADLKRAAAMLAQLRRELPGAGRGGVDGAGFRALKRRSKIRIVWSPRISRVAFLSPENDADGQRDLVLRRGSDTAPGVTLWQKRYLELFHSLRLRHRLSLAWEDACAAVARYCILNLHSCAHRGVDWEERTRGEINKVEGVSPADIEHREQLAAHLALLDHPSLAPPTPLSPEAEAERVRGVELRGGGDHGGAEAAFRRAHALAVKAGDWNTAANAIGGIGRVREGRRQYVSARYFYTRAFDEATAHGAADAAARSLHDLFSEAINAGQPRRADRLAPQVFSAYAQLRHENMYRFAHDLARFWLTEGCFAAALPIFEAVVERFPDDEKPYVLGNLAEAAGGIGARSIVEYATAAIFGSPRATFFARGLTGLAYARHALGENAEAADLARQAWEEAARRGDLFAMEDAQAVRRRTSVPTATQIAARSALAAEIINYSAGEAMAA